MLAVDTGVVEEWLSEFKTLPEASISNYATNLKDKSSLVSSLYKVIREPQSELLEPVCHQLFEFYRSGEERLLRFTLQFLPELMWCYLAVSASRDLQSSGCIEALLLGVYNLEIVDKQGHSKVLSFTIPSLSKPSVYHEPSSIGSMALTEGALSQHGLSRVVYSGPHPQREMLTAQNRFEVLTFLLLCYNAALSYMPAVSLQSLCQICSSYNGEWDLARKAMDDILYRAQLELYPEPLLVANAIKASLPQGAMKSSKEGTRCIQVEITPTSSRISRNAVTSMSIRGHRWKRHDNTDVAIPEELIEVSEVDEGFYSRATSSTSQSALSNSNNTSNKILLGKSQRRSGGSKVGGKEREASGESCKEDFSRKQTQRAMSENLDLLSLKRLTLTTSQSLPKPGSHSLARTTTTAFSKSFEQVSGITVPNNRSGGNGTEANRFSACSLQEEKLISGAERIDLPISNKQSNQQRPPSISITLSTD
ncbi:hyccin isoform X2 [Trachemys scripta elegans]|uniref:Hyccin PI4KA lipid kinase complex subunit 1 n=1 Tax=Chrysemys picta bellii TaxID=8478 RepID=A0A8C3IC62_CHRPI|nr:hyccin isoform X2 [Trachemys scripta elegans]XP_042701175.1 hyccin isoform X2 [Chrysemys picta bellii]